MNVRDIVGLVWPVLPVVGGGPEGAGPDVRTSVIERALLRGENLVLHLGQQNGIAAIPLRDSEGQRIDLDPDFLPELAGLTVMQAGGLPLRTRTEAAL